ncbi:hypothetical protein [Amycolatopsis sp. H20-H5]|uniref:hypothetical protein n=1 Tax=Amycolatopsis sp. H20-H5 TaxID=3046309 RepID=UPI002DBEC038|nr:hypothetical protein [Amycolatopsis sp. H20-H5]MEC3982132.1 hypothetical protein [Amycolatopsis sp. H20-H5]
MNHVDLAGRTAALLAGLLSNSLSGDADTAANRLFNLVSGRLVRKGESWVLQNLQTDPGSRHARNALAQRLGPELTDDSFRREVSACLDQSATTTSGSFAQHAGRDNFGAGRDLRVDQSERTSNTKNHFGGIVTAVVAVVAIIALGFGAKAVVGKLSDSLGPSLDSGSTCAQFLQADSAAQVAVMKKLYLAAGHADRAGDPFILQNATYSCGQSPNLKLGTLAAR